VLITALPVTADRALARMQVLITALPVTADRALARMQVLITAPSSLPFSPQVGCPFQLTELTGLRRNDSAATAPCGHGVTPCNPSLRPIDRNGARDGARVGARDGAREGGARLGSSPRPLEWGTHEFGGSGEEWMRRYVDGD